MTHDSKKLSNILVSATKGEWSLAEEKTNTGIDNGFKKEIKKVFSRADLWKIDRMKRPIISRRYY